MGVTEVKKLVKETIKNAFNRTTAVPAADVIIFDVMTNLYTITCKDMNYADVAKALLCSVRPLLSDTEMRLLVVVADKESLKPKEKAEEQKRRDTGSEVEPYPDNVEVTAEGILIDGTLLPRFNLSRLIRVRKARVGLFRQVARVCLEQRDVCFSDGLIGSVILDMVDGEVPKFVSSDKEVTEPPSWLSEIRPFGEGDLAMLEYLRAVRRSTTGERPPKICLVTVDSDVLPIFFGDLQKDLRLQVTWVGYLNEWCNLRSIVDSLVKRGWTGRTIVMTSALSGCDFVSKGSVTAFIGTKLILATILAFKKKGVSMDGTFDHFDKLLLTIYQTWIKSKDKRCVINGKTKLTWEWVQRQLVTCPFGDKLSPPYDSEHRRELYSRVVWLRKYWALNSL